MGNGWTDGPIDPEVGAGASVGTEVGVCAGEAARIDAWLIGGRAADVTCCREEEDEDEGEGGKDRVCVDTC